MGFVAIADLHRALTQAAVNGRRPSVDDVQQLLHNQTDRFEVQGDRVRARYGHSLDLLPLGPPAPPPLLLYHGTAQHWREAIDCLGLRSMGRRHVHLTSDLDYARSIALASDLAPLIARVEAAQAQAAGVKFWQANRHVWLAEAIAPQFIAFEDDPSLCEPVDPWEARLPQFVRSEQPSHQRATPSWYHVCGACNAKWFAPGQRCACLRCGRKHSSTEQRTPPWAGHCHGARIPPSA